MEKTFRSVAFWVASIAATAFLLLVITATVWAFLYAYSHPSLRAEDHAISLVTTYGVLLLVASCVFSCVFFGWRRDRREANQLRGQIVDIRLKLCELETPDDCS